MTHPTAPMSTEHLAALGRLAAASAAEPAQVGIHPQNLADAVAEIERLQATNELLTHAAPQGLADAVAEIERLQATNEFLSHAAKQEALTASELAEENAELRTDADEIQGKADRAQEQLNRHQAIHIGIRRLITAWQTREHTVTTTNAAHVLRAILGGEDVAWADPPAELANDFTQPTEDSRGH